MQGIDNLPKGGGSSTLSGLADVNFSSLTQGDLLIYDGAEWINHSFTEGHTILNESGTAVTARDNLQFTDGLKVTDDSGNNKTKVGVDTTFTEASTRANINSGDTFSTILGKIKKWFTDIPNLFVSKTGDTMTGALTVKNSDDSPLYVQSGVNDRAYTCYKASDGSVLGYIGVKSDGKAYLYTDSSKQLAFLSDIPEISVTLLHSNMYLPTADTFVSTFLSNTSLDDFDFIGFGWHRSDNPSNWNQIDTIVPTSVFKASTHSNPCYVLDDPYSSADDTRCVKVAYTSMNHYIDVYRGSAVWQYRRLAVFGIKAS